MAKRVPASMRTRQSLSDVIEGRLSSPVGREELVKLATRLIIEETPAGGGAGRGRPGLLRARGGAGLGAIATVIGRAG
jgi:hypothetical protein